MTDLLEGLDLTELQARLPKHVTGNLTALEKAGVDWNGIGIFLAAGPTSSVALKGPGRWTNALWDGVKGELRRFLCTDDSEYADLRSDWAGLKEKGSGIAVGALSGFIGAKLGVASGVLAPMIIWMLLVGIRIGKNGICAALAAASPPSDAPPTPPSPLTPAAPAG